MSPLILPFEGKVPRIHASAWIAPNATIIGDVEIGPAASVFYNVVLAEIPTRSPLARAAIFKIIRSFTAMPMRRQP